MTFSPTSTPWNPKKAALFLVLVVLGVYCRAATGTVVSIDDMGIMKFYGSARLFDAVAPGNGYYYRPVIALSFYLDKLLLGQNPVLLHLENILIHAANTVLVYILALRLLRADRKVVPLAAALFFAVHPVNSEAVSWIAGRTDPLAAFFVLLASISLLKGLETGRMRHTLAATALFAAGVMTKETALVFIPASLLLVAFRRRLYPQAPHRSGDRQLKFLAAFYLGISIVVAAVLLARTAGQNGLAKLLIGNTNDLGHSVLLAVQVFGFYVKKMFVPWPLNFAVTELSVWYVVPAVAVPLCFGFVRKVTPQLLATVVGVLFLAPAVVVGVCDVAWTVVAERYLYIPSAFFAVGLTGYLAAVTEVRRRQLAFSVVALCLAGSALATWHRTAVWQSNIALFEDAVAKNPTFGMLHNELGTAYAKAGRIADAEKEFDLASSQDISEMLKRLIRKNKLVLHLLGATPEAKRQLINRYGWRLVQEDADLLAILRANDYLILNNGTSGAQKEALIEELVRVSERLFTLTRDPLLLYNNGQLLIVSGDRGKARACFARCAAIAPDGAYYKRAAQKLAATLEGEE